MMSRAQLGLETELRECAAVADFRAPAAGLREHEVHVWWAPLDSASPEVARFRSVLSPDEVARAGRFHSPQHGNAFVLARGWLRTVLGAYLHMPPADLGFGYTAKGKPLLSGARAGCDLRFNLSHTEGMVLLGLARGRRIGVDIERVRHDIEAEDIAERFFSAAERAALRGIPAEQKHAAFFHCWTRKEAYIKATGEGLSLPLHQFDVALAPGEPAALLRTRPDPAEARRWFLQALPLDPLYAAALAVEACGVPLEPGQEPLVHTDCGRGPAQS